MSAASSCCGASSCRSGDGPSFPLSHFQGNLPGYGDGDEDFTSVEALVPPRCVSDSKLTQAVVLPSRPRQAIVRHKTWPLTEAASVVRRSNDVALMHSKMAITREEFHCYQG